MSRKSLGGSMLSSFAPSWPRLGMAALVSVLTIFLFVAFDGAALAQEETAASGGGVFDSLTNSGFIGVVILLCSIAGFSLAITFAFQIKRDVLVPPELLEQVQTLFDDEDYEEAYHVCEANPSFLSAVISSGLSRLDEGYDSMESAMGEAGEVESTRLHQKVGYLSMIANIAPMLGLLGTVYGMIVTFAELATAEVAPKPKDLASGISIALGTTFLGLTVAIPMSVIFVFFRNRVINVVVEVGAITDELMSRFKSDG